MSKHLNFIMATALCLLGISVILSSCEKDDDETNGNSKIVKTIEVHQGTEDGALLQTIDFHYKGSRVDYADYYGIEEVICGPMVPYGKNSMGARVHFNISGNTMTLRFCEPKTEKDLPDACDGDGYGQGTLENGYLVEEYLEATESDVIKNKFDKTYYTHNSKGQVTEMKCYGKSRKYVWDDDCIVKVSGNLGYWRGYDLSHTNIENIANLDLNRIIFDQWYSEDIFGLSLCGYISSNEKYLTALANWEIDNDGRVIKATLKDYKTYVFLIKYY